MFNYLCKSDQTDRQTISWRLLFVVLIDLLNKEVNLKPVHLLLIHKLFLAFSGS